MREERSKTVGKPKVIKLTRDLTESLTFSEVTDDSGALARVTAVLSTGDEINRNGRYYPVSVLAKAAEKANGAADRGELIGLLDHPNNGEGNKGTPGKTVLKWERVWMDGTQLKGEGLLLDTSAGRDLDAQRKARVRLGLSTNGFGVRAFRPASDVVSDTSVGDDLVEVIEDYELLTVDVVNDPASVSAALSLEARELRESYAKEEIVDKEKQAELEVQLETERAAREQAEARVTELEAAQKAAEALLEEAASNAKRAERAAIVTEALGNRTVTPEVRAVLEREANAAETPEAAREALKALVSALTIKEGHGNNGIPDTTGPVDVLAEARERVGVIA